ncbi:hypothetical protein B0T21DRAFT_346578 [Apiosordaria backusii]|uniref:Uncharacterized protein n=1 Tax=Apiosordaria backusii TaxID=314023 RepID=A0AA40BS26_9PEZI|nr:hypothetical protein B0T21DRAFT_346578 [Apiosordaria backusii]
MSPSFVTTHRPRITGGSGEASSSRNTHRATTPDTRSIHFARWIFEQQQRTADNDNVDTMGGDPNLNSITRHQSPVIVISDDEDDGNDDDNAHGQSNNSPNPSRTPSSLRSIQTSGTGIKRKISHTPLHNNGDDSTIVVRRPLPSSVSVEMQIDSEPIAEPADPVVPKDYFHSLLPLEIRNKIYRLLLVSPKPIPVKDLWQEVIRTSTRRTRTRGAPPTRNVTRRRGRVPAMGEEPNPEFILDPRILRVCKQSFEEAKVILYGENTFWYLLRDPNCVGPTRGSGGGGGSRTYRGRGRGYTAAAGAGVAVVVVVVHLSIEMERNRTGGEYLGLMTAALERLVCGGGMGSIPFHLRTLTVIVSPIYEQVARSVVVGMGGDGGNGNGNGGQQQHQHGGGQQQQQVNNNTAVTVREPRYLSVVGLFSRGSATLKALQRINVDFLRVSVHVNSHLDGRRGGEGDGRVEEEEEEQGQEDSEGEEEQVDGQGNPVAKPRRWHLEMTLDLRWLARHMEKLRKEGPVGELWENDAIVRAARVERGKAAERNLQRLRKLIEDACEMPEYVVKRGVVDGLWNTAEQAEVKRLEEKKRLEKRFEMDGYDNLDPSRRDVVELRRKLRKRRDDGNEEDSDEDSDENEDSDEEESGSDSEEDSDSDEESDDDEDGEEEELNNMPLSKKLKSLVISIDKVQGEWKCFRI